MSLSCRTTLDSWRLRWLRLGGFWEQQTSWRHHRLGLCESLLSRQETKAEGMLTALGLIDDTHGPFFLRRACSGWSKVLCSSRTVPPSQPNTALPPSASSTGQWGPLSQRTRTHGPHRKSAPLRQALLQNLRRLHR